MILPIIKVPITAEIFQIHFKHFLSDFVNEKNVKIKFNRPKIGSLQIRYELFFDQGDIVEHFESEEISAEIEILPIDEDITEIRIANLVIKPNEVWFDFFSSFYLMCYKKWPFFTKTDPDISENLVFDFLDIKDFIIDNVKSHGFDEEYYMSGEFLAVSDDFDTEQRRQRLKDDLSRRLPPIEVFKVDTFFLDRDGEEVNLTQKEQRKGGRRNLPPDEWIYRLAKAQEAEEIRKVDPEMTWKQICVKIGWSRGSTIESKIKLLETAREVLKEANQDTLQEVKEYRRKEKNLT